MVNILVVITLLLLPNGVVKKTTEEFYLKDRASCMSELDRVNFHFDNNNKNENFKLISLACITKVKA